MPAKFQYKSRPASEWKARTEMKSSNYIGYLIDRVKPYIPVVGQNWVRILPPTWDLDENGASAAKHYGLDVWLHQYIGPQGATVLCPLRHNKGKCPVCEAHDAGEAKGMEYDDLYEFRAVRRVLVWFLNRQHEQENKTDAVQAWAIPGKDDVFISGLAMDPMTKEVYKVDHHELGYDLLFIKEGEGEKTKYGGWQFVRRSSPVAEKWVEYAVENPLPEMLIWRNYQEVELLFTGGQAETGGVTVPANVPPGNPPVATQASGPSLADLMQPTPGMNAPLGSQPPPQQATTTPPMIIYCETTIKAGDKWYGCGFSVGHTGDHQFSREVPNPQSASGAAPATTVVPNGALNPSPSPAATAATPGPSTTVAQPAGPGATAKMPGQQPESRIGTLRERFASRS